MNPRSYLLGWPKEQFVESGVVRNHTLIGIPSDTDADTPTATVEPEYVYTR